MVCFKPNVFDKVWMFYRYTVIAVALFFLGLTPYKNYANPTDRHIPFFNSQSISLEIDGHLTESVWKEIPFYDDLVLIQPDLGEPGRYSTHVRYFYTEKGLYVGMRNEQPRETLLRRLSSRDAWIARDSMQVVIDPSGEGLYGYWFSVSLGNSVSDGIVLPERNYKRDWDGAWYGRSQIIDDGWTAELFIPWGIMDLPPVDSQKGKIGLYVSRTLGQLGERWSSPYLSMQQNRFLSAFNIYRVKTLKPSRGISVFPYASTAIDNIKKDDNYRSGIDIFWQPSSYLKLSAAIKPDFGQVEADDVVVNLTTFETFFPEKRLFFLESQALFSTFNRKGSSTTMLNTRRIGSNLSSRQGTPDDLTGVSEFDKEKPVELLGAIKMTGQVGSVRYGILTAKEDDTDVQVENSSNTALAGRDLGIARVIYEDTRGNGRRSLGWLGAMASHPNRSAVTQGIDAHLLSDDGRLNLSGQIMMSDLENSIGYGLRSHIQFSPENGKTHRIGVDYSDRNLNLNDLGYLKRTDEIGLSYQYELEQVDIPGLRERESEIHIRYRQNLDHERIGSDFFLKRKWKFSNNNDISLALLYQPETVDDRKSQGFGSFKRASGWSTGSQWKSDSSKKISYELDYWLQQASEGGYRKQIKSRITFRPSSSYSLSLRANYVKQDSWLLHDGEGKFTTYEAEEWSPSIVFNAFFTARQQLQLRFQWIGIKAHDRKYWNLSSDGEWLNEVSRPENDSEDSFTISNATLQARYRWELGPLSDLFIVYNRGGNVYLDEASDGFESLLGDSLNEPDTELLVMKLRYRFSPN